MFCPITPFQVVRIEKFIHKQELFFFQTIIFSELIGKVQPFVVRSLKLSGFESS